MTLRAIRTTVTRLDTGAVGVYPGGPPLPSYYAIFRANGAITFHLGALGDLTGKTPAPTAYTLYKHRVVIEDTGTGAVLFDRVLEEHWWNSQWTFRPGPLAVVKTPKQIADANRMFIFGKVPGMKQAGVPARKPFDIMGSSWISSYFPTTGERPDIGLVTDAGAQAMMGLDTANLIDAALASGTCPVHFRDEATGQLINLLKTKVNHYSLPGRLPGYWLDPGPPIPPSGPDPTAPGYDHGSNGYHTPADGHWGPQNAHYPEMAYLAYQFTLDPVFLEDLQYQANFQAVGDDGKWDALNRPIPTGEYRGEAWALRSLFMAHIATKDAEAAGALPATCQPSSYFKEILDGALAFFSTSLKSTDPVVQRFRLMGQSDRFGPWQHEYVMLALAFGVLTGHSDWTELFLWCLGNTIARTNGTSGYPPGWGGAYYLNTYEWAKNADGTYNQGLFDHTKPLDWNGTFLFQVNDPNGARPTPAQLAMLKADPLGDGKAIVGHEYLQNTHAVLTAAAYLQFKGLANVTAQYPELSACIANVERMIAGDTFNPRSSIVNDPAAAPVVVTPLPPVTTPPQPPTGDPMSNPLDNLNAAIATLKADVAAELAAVHARIKAIIDAATGNGVSVDPDELQAAVNSLAQLHNTLAADTAAIPTATS